MESLFEVLYQYAVENCCGPLSPEEREEQERCNDMLCRTMDELAAQGCGELAQQVEDGTKSLAWLGQRSLFRAGLSIGMALNRL